MLSTLSIEEGTAALWELEEHDWMDNLAREELTRLEVDCTTWFGYEEERKAHEELEGILHQLEELNLERIGRQEVPEPPLGEISGCAARGGDALKPSYPRCKNCAKWIAKNIKEVEWPDARLSGELIALIFKSLNESNCSERLICFEDQSVETLYDMKEEIISCQEAIKSIASKITTILSPGQENQIARSKIVSAARNAPDSEPVVPALQKMMEMSSTQGLTTTRQGVEEDNSKIRKGKCKPNKKNYFVGSCSQPSGAESEPGGRQKKQEPTESSGQEGKEGAEAPQTYCRPVPGRRILVPGKGRSKRQKKLGTIAVRRIDDLLKLMTSKKRRNENECSGSGWVLKKSRK